MDFSDAKVTIMGDHVVVKGNYIKTTYYGFPQSANSSVTPCEVEDVVPVSDQHAQEPAVNKPDFAAFENYLAVAFYQKRESDYNAALDMICDTDYSDREKAYFALVLYQTQGILKTSKRPKTFNAWYKVFCDIFHLKYHADYHPDKIAVASDKAKLFDTYVYQPVHVR
jgi:hypothetical protein